MGLQRRMLCRVEGFGRQVSAHIIGILEQTAQRAALTLRRG